MESGRHHPDSTPRLNSPTKGMVGIVWWANRRAIPDTHRVGESARVLGCAIRPGSRAHHSDVECPPIGNAEPPVYTSLPAGVVGGPDPLAFSP